MILTAMVAAPFALGCLAWALPRRLGRRLLFIGASFLQVTFVARVASVRPAPEWGGALDLDSLGLLFLALLTGLFALAAVYTFGYMALHRHPKHRHYVPALLFFLGSMTLAALTRHMGLFWVALEATTLSSASLIFFDRSPRSLEAAWKYLILCSVGIALALAGTFFLALALPPDAEGSLLLDHLLAVAPAMSAPWVKTAFLFLLVGYGTKMGLAPMHAWLPDAHAEAPSPVSALLSGALLNCAFLGILRAYQVTAHAGHADFAGGPLTVLGLVSMGTAAAFMIRQPDYKRLLAYSSVEHMGILAVGLGLGTPRGTFAALLHAANHSVAKALLFFVAGSILLLYRTKSTSEVAGLGKRDPVAATLWIVGFLAITGTPPFGLFVSEVNLLFAALGGGHFVVAGLYLLFLAVAFAAMAALFIGMVFGDPPQGTEGAPLPGRYAALLHGPAILLALTTLGLGLHLPDGFLSTLWDAVASLGVAG